jgi:DNA processing protein
MNDRRRYEIGLSLLPCLKPADARLLLERVGSAEAVFCDKHLSSLDDLNPKVLHEIKNSNLLKQADDEIDRCLRHDIHIRFLTDPDYPFRLSACPDAPLVLYSRGSSDLNAKRIVSVVGTRHATSRGREFTEELVRKLAGYYPDLVVVSGLAYGIDIAANRTAVTVGLNTVAVVAHGLHEIYPVVHRQTALDIVKNGSILSELPYETSSEPWRFIQRNRVVAGLCDACIVVESAKKGGSMYTADMAAGYGREVFALPGRPSDEWSKGCNLLIKKQVASLFECAEDILTAMNWGVHKRVRSDQMSLFPELSPCQKAIYEQLLSGEGKSMGDFSFETAYSMSEILSNLMQLELDGLIQTLPGGIYQKKKG